MNKIRFEESYIEGFRGVKHIDDDFGLLFKHSGSMIMDGCFIPLTAIYLDKNLKIVGNQELKPEPEPPYSYTKYALKGEDYSYVLEIKSGILGKLSWNIGDTLLVKDNTITRSISIKSVPLSSISLPKEGLDKAIWAKDGDEYILQPLVSSILVDTLFEKLHEFGYKGCDKWVKGIYLIGSETGNLYDEDSDLDVQILVDEKLFEEYHG